MNDKLMKQLTEDLGGLYAAEGVHSAKAKLDSGGRIEYYSPTAVKEETEVKPKRKKKEKKIG